MTTVEYDGVPPYLTAATLSASTVTRTVISHAPVGANSALPVERTPIPLPPAR